MARNRRPGPVATGELALDLLATRLRKLDANAFRDVFETLDGEQWVDVRRLAGETLTQLVPE
ncbi:MAG TPA: hypothetical protein VME46_15685 [Acidimicrobiales bacterium]|nr:hypothetical protein [Acidimicrobiales bacterium]